MSAGCGSRQHFNYCQHHEKARDRWVLSLIAKDRSKMKTNELGE